jgi:hypothetical protein
MLLCRNSSKSSQIAISSPHYSAKVFQHHRPASKFLLSAKLEMILTDCEGSGVDGGDTDSSSERKSNNIPGNDVMILKIF